MPKLPFTEKRRAITAMIPEGLFIETKLLLLDPNTGRVKYGSMSGLITQILTEYVEARRKGRETVDPMVQQEKFEDFSNDGT